MKLYKTNQFKKDIYFITLLIFYFLLKNYVNVRKHNVVLYSLQNYCFTNGRCV